MPSVQHASRKAILGSGNDKVILLHDIRSNWILQLDNSVLRKLVANYTPHLRPKSSDIEAINQAHATLVSNREFSQRLNRAGFYLSTKQVKCVNEENRQIFYRCCIENKVLRDLLSNYRLHTNRWQVIAKNQIDTLNRLLHRAVSPSTLHAALKRLKVKLSEEQLQAVIKESRTHHEASPYVSARNDYETLQHMLLTSDLKNIKQQFSDYLSLILNESALSISEVNTLKEELMYVVVRKTDPIRVENPFISAIKSIQRKADQLREKHMLLSHEYYSVYTNQLLNQIDKILLRISKYSYELLFRQQVVLEKWANSKNMSDVLYREIQHLAPRCVLKRTEAKDLLHKLRNQSLRRVSSL